MLCHVARMPSTVGAAVQPYAELYFLAANPAKAHRRHDVTARADLCQHALCSAYCRPGDCQTVGLISKVAIEADETIVKLP